jgi:HK97 family phage major capsid protein
VKYVQQLLEERDQITREVMAMSDKAADEGKELTPEQRNYILSQQSRAEEIDVQLAEHNRIAESTRSYASLIGKLQQQDPDPVEQRGGTPRRELPSAGDMFVESAAFKGYAGRGQSGVVEMAGYAAIEQRAVITTADLAIPNMVLPPRVPDISIPPMLQIVDVVSTTAGVASWVEISGDPQAQVVAEGAAKPEAALTYTPRTAPLDTLAHWVQITRQALEDASYIRSVIEGKLRRGITLAIADAIQDAIVAATLPTATAPAGPNSLLNAIRVGVGTVQSAGYNPNAVVLNPADWASLDASVMGSTLGGPTVGTNFWGLTPVASRFQTAGVALVGDFKAGVAWFDRGVSNVFISDSHADLFIKNTLVILAETRGKAAVPEPLALCECSATAGP